MNTFGLRHLFGLLVLTSMVVVGCGEEPTPPAPPADATPAPAAAPASKDPVGAESPIMPKK